MLIQLYTQRPFIAYAKGMPMYKEVLTLKKALITSAVAASLALTGCATGEDSAESGS